MRRPHDVPRTRPAEVASPDARQGMVDFLVARLTEDLALLWRRDSPGTAGHVAVIDELLVTLRSGALPHRRELRMLLFGYGRHPDYDPGWTQVLTLDR